MSNSIFKVVLIIVSCQCSIYECLKNDTTSHKYLDEFISGLQEISQYQSETPCEKTVINLLNNVQNNTLWASWIWNSMSTAPVGYLSGTRYQLGSYDQCLNPPWLESHPELRTKYCLVYIQPEGPYIAPNTTRDTDISPFAAANTFTHFPRRSLKDFSSFYWGLCLPEICDAEFVKTFTSVLLKYNNFGNDFAKTSITVENCYVAGGTKPFSWLNCVFITTFAVLTIIAVTSTYAYKKGVNSNVMEIARAFSITENVDKLTRWHPEELESLNGIRFFCAALIVLLHQMFITIYAAPFNRVREFEEMSQSAANNLSYGLPYIVDCFFVMSGLLSVIPLISAVAKMQWQNTLKLVSKRYFRLAPLLAVTILICMVMLKHFESGPMWAKAAGLTLDQCKSNWWLSVLMISNYVHTDKLCYGPSWTVPCDFHMSIVSFILLYLYSKKRQAGLIAFAFVFALSMILPALTTYTHDLPATILNRLTMTKEYVDYFNLVYVKSHTRFGPYLIGMILGYGMSAYEPKTYKNCISQTVSIVGALAGLGIMIALGMLNGLIGQGGFPRIVDILFAATHRTVFGAAFALLVICLVYGTVPLINDFLCWNVFRPLSRLSYGVYLLHCVPILTRYGASRVVLDRDLATHVVDGLGTIVLSVMMAFITWLLVEAPINHLCNYWLKPARECPKETEMDRETSKELNTISPNLEVNKGVV